MYHHGLIDEDSSSIFKKISRIKELAVDNKDTDLEIEADLLRAHYFYYRSKFAPAYVISILDSVKQKAIDLKKIWAEAMIENMLALYHFDHLKEYELGFEHHQRVYKLIKDIDPKDFPHKQNCLYQMAGEHYAFKDYRQSIFFNLEALKAETPPEFKASSMELSIVNTIGLSYHHLGMQDSAEYFFRKTLSLAAQKKSRAWEGIASGNLGNVYFLRRQYNNAKTLLQKDVAIAKEFGDWGLASGSLMVLAEIALNEKDVISAGRYLDTARKYIYASGQYARLQDLYPLLSKWHSAVNQPAAASVYLDSALTVRDSLAKEFNALQMLRAKQKVGLEQHRSEVEQVTQQKKISILERNVLVGLVVLMMIAAIFIYREQQRRSKAQQEAIARGDKELADASRQLNEFAKNISEKNALIELLQQQNNNGNNTLLQQLQQSTILTDSDWEYFRQLFEKVHGGFLHRLKEKIPGLTPAETRFMVLSKLDLNNKEMAAMLGIGTDAIRQYRSRLRKKLNLSEDGSLEEMVSHI